MPARAHVGIGRNVLWIIRFGTCRRGSGRRAPPAPPEMVDMPDGARLVAARDAKLDRFLKRMLHRRGRKKRECVLGDCAVMASALDRVVERAMARHQRDRMIEVFGAGVALFE